MKNYLISAAAVICAAGFFPAAQADELNLYAEADVQIQTLQPVFKPEATIAVARLDGGRMIATPHVEVQDWDFLTRRTNTTFEQLGAGRYIQYIPEIPYGNIDTENKIDEIRLTAAGEGYDYVLIYGVGPDASWASFGGKTLLETGLSVHGDCASWEGARAKALLVDSRSGHVFGAVTADEIDYNIGQLADRVELLIKSLSGSQEADA